MRNTVNITMVPAIGGKRSDDSQPETKSSIFFASSHVAMNAKDNIVSKKTRAT